MADETDDAWIERRAAALKADVDIGNAILDDFAMIEIGLALREAIARGRADTAFVTKDGHRYTVLDGRPD